MREYGFKFNDGNKRRDLQTTWKVNLFRYSNYRLKKFYLEIFGGE